jgi:hypothetical protein
MMNRKLLISAAPLLVIAALAVLPAASQAAPHVYKNGVISPESKILREIWWGTLKMKNSAIGEIECHNIVAGFEENPVGGAPAIGTVQGFVPYECVSASCTALGGKAIEVISGKLPWSIAASEPKPSVFREEIGNGELETNCIGVAAPKFSGGMDALIQSNGTSIGSGPDELAIESEKVNPEAHNLKNGTETLETEGKLKRQGYGTEELIEVKNP